ncbi:unnamed protein product [Closterium sp. NIES-64]|nr:unnamed protein product [Closterium sp. NIES-64]
MRVFTEYPVNCYNIPVAKPGRYLLRLVMYYGNYDKAKSPPAFNVSFGISFAATVVLTLKERVVSEIIGQVDSTELEVCFVSIYGKPLVNALELRPLPAATPSVTSLFFLTFPPPSPQVCFVSIYGKPLVCFVSIYGKPLVNALELRAPPTSPSVTSLTFLTFPPPSPQVCFVSIYGKPLVNALELRPLPPASYVSLPDPSGVMLLWWRLFSANDSLTNRMLRRCDGHQWGRRLMFDCHLSPIHPSPPFFTPAATPTIPWIASGMQTVYPYDPLDRIWDADGVMATSGSAASSTLMFDYSFSPLHPSPPLSPLVHPCSYPYDPLDRIRDADGVMTTSGGAPSSTLMFDYSLTPPPVSTPLRLSPPLSTLPDRIWDADGVMATSGGAASSTLIAAAAATSAAIGTGDSGRTVVGESASVEAEESAQAAATAAAAAAAAGTAGAAVVGQGTAEALAPGEASSAVVAAASEQAITGNGTTNAAPAFLQLTARTVPQAPGGTMDSSSGLEYQFQFLESPANFQLILYFTNVEGRVKRAGDMVFDIVLNEQVVVGRFDLFLQLQGAGRAARVGPSGVGGSGVSGSGVGGSGVSGSGVVGSGASGSGVVGSGAVEGGGDVTAHAAAIGLAAAPATPLPSAAAAAPSTLPNPSATAPAPAPPPSSGSSSSVSSSTDSSLYAQQVVMVVVNFTSVDLYIPAILLLRPVATSRLPPAISGIEMYEVFPAAKPTPADEVSALREFQRLLGAPASLAGWQGSDPCNPIKWAGIQCTQAQGDSESHVSGIYLGNYSLHGPISPALANVSRLQHLWVNDNNLENEIPSSLGDLGDLSTLLLQNNHLTGGVPQSLTNLTNLGHRGTAQGHKGEDTGGTGGAGAQGGGHRGNRGRRGTRGRTQGEQGRRGTRGRTQGEQGAQGHKVEDTGGTGGAGAQGGRAQGEQGAQGHKGEDTGGTGGAGAQGEDTGEQGAQGHKGEDTGGTGGAGAQGGGHRGNRGRRGTRGHRGSTGGTEGAQSPVPGRSRQIPLFSLLPSFSLLFISLISPISPPARPLLSLPPVPRATTSAPPRAFTISPTAEPTCPDSFFSPYPLLSSSLFPSSPSATGNDLCSPQGLYDLPNCRCHVPFATLVQIPSVPPSPSADSSATGRNVLVGSVVGSLVVAAIASALVVWMYFRGARKDREKGERGEKEEGEKRGEVAAAGGGGGGEGGDGDEGSGKRSDGYGGGSGRGEGESGRQAVGVSRSGSREDRGSERGGESGRDGERSRGRGEGGEFSDRERDSMPLSGPNSSSTEPLLPNGNVSERKSDPNVEGSAPAITATHAATGAAAAAATAAAATAAAAEAAHNGQKAPPNGLAVEAAPFTVPSTHVQRMSLAELEEATGGFCEEQMIGAGGFGPVYRGVLANGRVVAVKRRAVDSMQGSTEFNNELKFLSKIRHPHLVALIAFCEEQGQQLLVYEFMAQGNLREHLYAPYSPIPHSPLPLSSLPFRIPGIEYLHVALRPSIIHRDIKTTNILLDDSLCAKVADFGLSRLGPQDNTHVSTNVKGTAGYLDPEYYTVQQLTDRSDVFSFGVVLLELVSGRQPIDLSRPRVDWNIIDWARKHLQQGDIEAIVDPTLPPSEFLIDAMWKVAEVGILCVEPMGINRPSISEVVRELGEAVAMELSNTPVRNHFHQQQHQRQHQQHQGQEGEGQQEYDSEIGVDYGDERGGGRGGGGEEGGRGGERLGGQRGYYNSTLTFSRSGSNGGDSSRGVDGRRLPDGDRGGEHEARDTPEQRFGRGENPNRVVPAELAMSWRGGGEASGGMRGDGDGSGEVWAEMGGVSERVSERVSGGVSKGVSARESGRLGWGGSGEGLAGTGGGEWSGSSVGRPANGGGVEAVGGGGGGGGGGGRRRGDGGGGEGGSAMGFRGPGSGGEMYIRRGGSSEELNSHGGVQSGGVQRGGMQGDAVQGGGLMAAPHGDYMMLRKVQQGVMSPPVPQEKRHFSAEDKPRFASPFGQPGFQPRAGGRDFESAREPAGGHGVRGNSEGKRRMSDGEGVDLNTGREDVRMGQEQLSGRLDERAVGVEQTEQRKMAVLAQSAPSQPAPAGASCVVRPRPRSRWLRQRGLLNHQTPSPHPPTPPPLLFHPLRPLFPASFPLPPAVSLTLVPAAAALRYGQAEPPPKLDYASCAAEVEEWVDVQMAETAEVQCSNLLNQQSPSPPPATPPPLLFHPLRPLFPASFPLPPAVSFALVPAAAALRYGQSEPPPKLDYASCAAEVEEWVDVQMAETAEVQWQREERMANGESPMPQTLFFLHMAETAEVQWQREERMANGESPMPQTLFFLHVAHAGGRTYHQCFLSTLMPSTVQCNMSYHVLRDDPTMGCRLLATHDDYGMTTQLPPGAATGVTTLFREPLDRVLSMYEFSVHISGRSMGLDLKQLPDETLYAARRKMREHYRNLVPTDTRNVWPWTLLSVTMEEDLWDRRDFTGVPPPPVGFDEGRDDMYSRAHLVMPLRDFIELPLAYDVVHNGATFQSIELPLAYDVVHNGATFQLAGITNNSVLPEAKRLRQCVLQHPDLGGEMLKLAKARVDALIHLGFTDRMEESIELLLAVLDRSLSSQAFTLPGTAPSPPRPSPSLVPLPLLPGLHPPWYRSLSSQAFTLPGTAPSPPRPSPSLVPLPLLPGLHPPWYRSLSSQAFTLPGMLPLTHVPCRSCAMQVMCHVGKNPRGRCKRSKKKAKENERPWKSIREQYAECLKDQMELTQLNELIAFRHMGPLKFSRKELGAHSRGRDEERARIPEDVMRRIKELNVKLTSSHSDSPSLSLPVHPTPGAGAEVAMSRIKELNGERARIPEDVMRRIKELNALDLELTEYARDKYTQMLDKYQPMMEAVGNPSTDRC